MEMLKSIQANGGDYNEYIRKAKDKNDPFRLMGFGHRVYKNYDPRARIIKSVCNDLSFRSSENQYPIISVAA